MMKLTQVQKTIQNYQRIDNLKSIFLIVSIFACIFYVTVNNIAIKKTGLYKRSSYQSDWMPGFFNLSQFKYLVQQSACSELDIKPEILIVVHSNPSEFYKRQTIRLTWGDKDLQKYAAFRLLFALGTTENSQFNQAIASEGENYGDIIQGSFIESYNNLTYKTFMMLRWYKEYCPEAQVLLKVNEHVFVNTPILLKSFKKGFWNAFKELDESFIYCHPFKPSNVVRNPSSKYYVPLEEYDKKSYPRYCEDHAVFYSKKAAVTLHDIGLKFHYVRIADAFLTGIVRTEANLNITDFEPTFTRRLLQDIKDDLESIQSNFFIGPNGLKSDEMSLLWNKITSKNSAR